MTANIDNIFCLVGSFVKRLKEDEWSVITENNIRMNKKGDRIQLLDQAVGRIAEIMDKYYEVKEKDVGRIKAQIESNLKLIETAKQVIKTLEADRDEMQKGDDESG